MKLVDGMMYTPPLKCTQEETPAGEIPSVAVSIGLCGLNSHQVLINEQNGQNTYSSLMLFPWDHRGCRDQVMPPDLIRLSGERFAMRRINWWSFRAARLRRCILILASFLFISVAFPSPAQEPNYCTKTPSTHISPGSLGLCQKPPSALRGCYTVVTSSVTSDCVSCL